VGYGKNLQEFLLKYVPIIAIYDNPKRSFAHADVNTIIALFGAPKFEEEKTIHGLKVSGNGNNWPMLNHTAKFVMFKKPFEEVINAKNLIDIENIKIKVKNVGLTELVKNVVKTNDYRVFPILQEDLLEDGWEYPENYDNKKSKFKAGNYTGNKWGGKFLRAPDIFFTILEKGKGKLKRLKNIGVIIKRGVKSGADSFFIVNKSVINKYKLEKEYWEDYHILESTQDSESINISPDKLNKFFINVNKPKKDLKPNILRYISYGERRGFNKKKSIKNRKYWYALNLKDEPDILFPLRIRKTFIVYCGEKIFGDHSIAEITIKKDSRLDKEVLTLTLNSSLSLFFMEILGRGYGGGGGPNEISLGELRNLWIIIPSKSINEKLRGLFNRKINDIFEELGFDPSKPIREQEPKPLPDRAELDKIIFDELGLTEEERKEVYWAVAELVKQRLEKARSLRG
jgi:hypothetical protein